MNTRNTVPALLLGVGVLLGFTALGFLFGNGVEKFKSYERTVTVKGLAEREVPADIVIWPIQFTAASNDLPSLYQNIAASSARIERFLNDQGIDPDEVTVSLPAITDKLAQQYGGQRAEFRYSALQTVTVYSDQVDKVREAMQKLADLGKEGIAFSQGNYQGQIEYIYTGLNDIKPEMVEQATLEARLVAQKFAEDSDSVLGKIKRASQGQFSIRDRDKNNPHIKKVRVVSTVEYYLSD
ncbi:SIMPL domain-containing protein [Microbulbifer thermotolerans]|uniref:SIMPL domain-containing protein n=1 Tax=Microbulbifer thermotolerans TaxID=252514 RepID=UPI0022499422|nr:SIMPL domain-containing protein [Microbulbifer thermotolerans]MCX2831371.1 SIMPL domain-containing protein [Microbulbifer thermotolerans]